MMSCNQQLQMAGTCQLETLGQGLDLLLQLQLAAAGHQGLVLLLSDLVTLVNTSSGIRGLWENI